jgi:hypothetical protein
MGIYCAERKLLNRASVDHTISKQEAMCLLGNLHLNLCLENIEDVSLSPFRRVVHRKEGDQDNKTTRTYWVSKYESRQGGPVMSLHYYITTVLTLNKKAECKKEVVPHCTGSIQLCAFPLSETYCYQVLLAYKPWSNSNLLSNKCGKLFCNHFLSFVVSYSCPK